MVEAGECKTNIPQIIVFGISFRELAISDPPVSLPQQPQRMGAMRECISSALLPDKQPQNSVSEQLFLPPHVSAVQLRSLLMWVELSSAAVLPAEGPAKLDLFILVGLSFVYSVLSTG